MGFAGAMVVAMAVDALIGWPSPLFARIGHPVTWLGWLINLLDGAWNRTSDPSPFRRAAGAAAAILVIALAAALGWAVQSMLASEWAGVVVVGVLQGVSMMVEDSVNNYNYFWPGYFRLGAAAGNVRVPEA